MRNTGIEKLSVKEVQNAKPKAIIGDGGGLYVRNRVFVFRYTSPVTHRERDISIGSVLSLPLKTARETAARYRAQTAQKIDPRDAQRKERRAAAAASLSFGEVAAMWCDARLSARKNARARRAALARHTKALAPEPAASITSMMIADALAPLSDRPAQRDNIVGLIYAIFKWAYAADKIPEALNPARREKLSILLPPRDRAPKPNTFVPLDALPAFMERLAAIEGNLARSLEFVIHSGLRQAEARALRWSWVNLADRSLTIPGDAMKAGKAHSVYLSDAALAISPVCNPRKERVGWSSRGAIRQAGWASARCAPSCASASPISPPCKSTARGRRLRRGRPPPFIAGKSSSYR